MPRSPKRARLSAPKAFKAEDSDDEFEIAPGKSRKAVPPEIPDESDDEDGVANLLQQYQST